MGKNTLGKRIEQSRVSLSIVAKMLEKMTANQRGTIKTEDPPIHLKFVIWFFLKSTMLIKWNSNGAKLQDC